MASTLSGSEAFDKFRLALASDAGLRAELENALRVNVNRVNPSDRGNRFIVGGAVEWLLAAAAWETGVLTIPGGHGVNGFDLLDVQGAARGLWSVKSQSSRRGAAFRISNGLGGGGRGLVEPTVFLSPSLPGLVLVHPDVHAEVLKAQRHGADAVTLPFRAIRQHADQHPECVAELVVAANEGKGTENPFLSYTKTILTPEQFPRLSSMFVQAEPRKSSLVEALQELVNMRDNDAITQAQFDVLVEQLS